MTYPKISIRPPSPPLYTPFYLVSGYFVKYLVPRWITPNMLTLGWIGLMNVAGILLAMDRTRVALPFVLSSIFLDCLDGDLARARFRESASGSLLERAGHWWSNMTLVAGAGIGICNKNNCPLTISILGACLCVALAFHLALFTDVRQFEVPKGLSTKLPTKLMRVLFVAVKINHYATPKTLPFAVGLALLGLDARFLWATVVLLFGGALSVLLQEFTILLYHDRLKLKQNSDFLQSADETDQL